MRFRLAARLEIIYRAFLAHNVFLSLITYFSSAPSVSHVESRISRESLSLTCRSRTSHFSFFEIKVMFEKFPTSRSQESQIKLAQPAPSDNRDDDCSRVLISLAIATYRFHRGLPSVFGETFKRRYHALFHPSTPPFPLISSSTLPSYVVVTVG